MTRKWLYFFLVAIDIMVTSLSMILAVYIRFDGMVPYRFLDYAVTSLPILIVIRLCCFYFINLYNRIWRYASIRELTAIVAAVSLSSVLFFFYCHLTGNTYGIPRGVHAIAAFLTIMGVGVSRLFVRIMSYYRYDVLGKYGNHEDVNNILIIGAGDAGAMVAKEFFNHQNSQNRLVGFIDDDPNKIGMSMFGAKILGNRNKIREITEKFAIDEIIIAMPSVEGREFREILALCENEKISARIKTVPGLYDIIDDKFTLSQLRSVEVEDLLRRKKVDFDKEEVARYLKGKIVIVTGAGGSIGSEICRQIAHMSPQRLLLLGRGENSIYEIENELKRKFPGLETLPIIADVKDEDRINDIFSEYKPQVVFHAAAHKHVPLMEAQPIEAVHNNIRGTMVVARAAKKNRAERFIMISTDKAINPTSVMGATKRVAEMIVSSLSQSGSTVFAAVRFGNVLGSRGSVVPLFKKQIEEGGPVTVTHPEMKRYFMTIPEASQLVLQAGAFANGGEIFVLDMGEPVKIYDLVVDLIKLTGYKPNEDIEIKFTGLRPGEKLFEELLSSDEGNGVTKHEKIFVANLQKGDHEKLSEQIKVLLETKDTGEIIHSLCEIVKTYSPNR